MTPAIDVLDRGVNCLARLGIEKDTAIVVSAFFLSTSSSGVL